MFPIEIVLNLMAGVPFLLATAWLFLSIHVLYFSEKSSGVAPFWTQFWPFAPKMRELYPGNSGVGRFLTIWAALFAVPWLVGRYLGYC